MKACSFRQPRSEVRPSRAVLESSLFNLLHFALVVTPYCFFRRRDLPGPLQAVLPISPLSQSLHLVTARAVRPTEPPFRRSGTLRNRSESAGDRRSRPLLCATSTSSLLRFYLHPRKQQVTKACVLLSPRAAFRDSDPSFPMPPLTLGRLYPTLWQEHASFSF